MDTITKLKILGSGLQSYLTLSWKLSLIIRSSSLDPSNLKVTVTILQASDKCRSKLSVNNTHHQTLFTCHLSSCHITTESGLSQAVGYSLFSHSVIVDKIRTPPYDTLTIHIRVCWGLNSAKRDSLRGILYWDTYKANIYTPVWILDVLSQVHLFEKKQYLI